MNRNVVTISAGVNDVWFGKVSYEQFCQNEKAMVAKVADYFSDIINLKLENCNISGNKAGTGAADVAGKVKQ